MPQKNAIKEYSADAYYHIYARGINKRKIFLDAKDYEYFLGLFSRYLSTQEIMSTAGGMYPNFSKNIDLISYCLMPNHFHLFVYQHDTQQGIAKLMSSLMTSYSKYFNKKYKRVGTLYDSRYKGKRIHDESYFMHISRYIHMNPWNWQSYSYSSLRYTFSDNRPTWLKTDLILSEFDTFDKYLIFLKEYEGNKKLLDEIKHELADK